MSSQPSALRVRDIYKNFGSVAVLRGLDLDIGRGEVHGLVGQNGSGKSTLIKILGGVYSPEIGGLVEASGVIQEFPIDQPYKHGIAIIHQDLALAENMPVGDNIGISSGYDTGMFARINRRLERDVSRELLAEFGLDIDPSALVDTLTPVERSVTAIVRAMRQMRNYSGSKVLVLDEPTAALPLEESRRLYGIVRRLAASGAGVLFVSHRIKEVLALCDRVSVLRDGKLVATRVVKSTSERELVTLMLGYDIGDFYPTKHAVSHPTSLVEVAGLAGEVVRDVSFTAGKGEIIGVTGLAGMGQDELPYLLSGVRRLTSGSVVVKGKPVVSLSTGRNAGVALVPGNRHRDGVWLGGTAAENLTIPYLARFARHGHISHKREQAFATKELATIGLRPLAPGYRVDQFSGGNQQKIVLAKWLQTNPCVLILHEPTQGVDVSAKKEVLELVRQAADAGAAVVICSSDADEIAETCHRAIILRFGSISDVLNGAELTSARLAASLQ
jgi:ribose transport system ATP-binding protein